MHRAKWSRARQNRDKLFSSGYFRKLNSMMQASIRASKTASEQSKQARQQASKIKHTSTQENTQARKKASERASKQDIERAKQASEEESTQARKQASKQARERASKQDEGLPRGKHPNGHEQDQDHFRHKRISGGSNDHKYIGDTKH